ncbi:unnamed protein product [Closterium sp. Naga37s-1]|nr:unnamed protein product [Closterium sp. Naga37s-1]
MPRKHKGQARDDCPKDLNEIPYIRWMNVQIANGRHPTGLSAPRPLDGQGSSVQSPRAGSSRVRRQPTRTAAPVRPVAEPDEDESDSEYRGDAVGSDDKDNEPEDLEMSDDEEGDDVAEEEVQPMTPPAKWNANRVSGADKRKGKATVEEPRHEPRKKRATAPREKSMWSDRESTIFVAARWFAKDEFQLLKGKQGTQYWARLLAHIKESNPDWIRGVNALQKQWRNLMLLWKEYKRGDMGPGNGSVEKPPWWPYKELYNKDTAAADPHAVDGGGATNVNVPVGMEIPTSSQPGTSTPTFTAPPAQTTPTTKRALVHETATMQAAMLVSATIKDCHGDAMNRIEGLVREWMQQDLRLARERMSDSAPPHVQRGMVNDSPPPPRAASAPPPDRRAPDPDGEDAGPFRDDGGDANTVTPGDDDVEIWVRGADD